jgi:hypothetical protein
MEHETDVVQSGRIEQIVDGLGHARPSVPKAQNEHNQADPHRRHGVGSRQKANCNRLT